MKLSVGKCKQINIYNLCENVKTDDSHFCSMHNIKQSGDYFVVKSCVLYDGGSSKSIKRKHINLVGFI